MAIVGNSGSGKSTLLNILGGLDRPSAGACSVGGLDLVNASGAELAEYKRYDVGFVWQQSARNLIPYLSALDNVLAPMLFAGGAGSDGAAAGARAAGGVRTLGTDEPSSRRSFRAASNNAWRLRWPWPTSPSCCWRTSPRARSTTRRPATSTSCCGGSMQDRRLTVMIVTHDRDVTRHVGRVVAIRDGQTSSEIVRRVGLPGADEPAHEEFVIVDETGRLQIPRDYLEELGISGRATVDVDAAEGRLGGAASGTHPATRGGTEAKP